MIKTISDIESVTSEYENLGYFYLIQTVTKEKSTSTPDDIFAELTQNENYIQTKMKNLLTNDQTFAYFINQGYIKAVLELYKNKTGNFTSEDENSDLLLLYLFFEGICKNKEQVRGYYLKFGPQARIYQKFKSEINTSLSIIDLFDKLKKLKIQDDYKLKIEEENRKKAEKARWISMGLCELCGGSIANHTCVKCNDIKSRKIGDIGPAGGIVFYDKGRKSDGWRYLEASPANKELNAEWGAYGKNISGTRTEIGYGKLNTQIIAKFLNNIGETDNAAQQCLTLSINGHNDWFLPSKDELNEMYYQRKIISGFNVKNNPWYWSSSQSSNNNAWIQYFKNGNQGYVYKHNPNRVRAIRAF